MDWVSELYNRHARKMFKVAFRILGDYETVEDIVQNVFVKMLNKAESLQTHENIEGWLYVTLRNEIGNVLGQQARHRTVPLEENLICQSEPEIKEGLISVLPVQLSKEDKEILTARYEDELSYAEISNVTGLNPDACKMRLSRARKRLKRLLSPSADGSGDLKREEAVHEHPPK